MVVYGSPEEQRQAENAAAARAGAPASQWFGQGGGLEQYQASQGGGGAPQKTEQEKVQEQLGFYSDVAQKAYPTDEVAQKKYYNYLVMAHGPQDIERRGVYSKPDLSGATVEVRPEESLRYLQPEGLRRVAETGPENLRGAASVELARREKLVTLGDPDVEVVINRAGLVATRKENESGVHYANIGVLGKDVYLSELEGKRVVPVVDVTRFDKMTGETVAIGSLPLSSAIAMAARVPKYPGSDYVGEFKVADLDVIAKGSAISGKITNVAGYEYSLKGELPAGISYGDLNVKEPVVLNYTTGTVEGDKALMDAAEMRAAEGVSSSIIDSNPLAFGAGYVRTLLSPQGYELLGASVRSSVTAWSDTSDIKKIVTGKLGQEYVYSKIENVGDRFIRGVTDAIQSPVVEVEASLVGGAALGRLAQISKVGSFLKSPVGKATVAGGGIALVTPRAVDVAVSYGTGDINRAIGLTFTTGADVFAGVAGFKMTAPAAGSVTTYSTKGAARPRVPTPEAIYLKTTPIEGKTYTVNTVSAPEPVINIRGGTYSTSSSYTVPRVSYLRAFASGSTDIKAYGKFTPEVEIVKRATTHGPDVLNTQDILTAEGKPRSGIDINYAKAGKFERLNIQRYAAKATEGRISASVPDVPDVIDAYSVEAKIFYMGTARGGLATGTKALKITVPVARGTGGGAGSEPQGSGFNPMRFSPKAPKVPDVPELGTGSGSVNVGRGGSATIVETVASAKTLQAIKPVEVPISVEKAMTGLQRGTIRVQSLDFGAIAIEVGLLTPKAISAVNELAYPSRFSSLARAYQLPVLEPKLGIGSIGKVDVKPIPSMRVDVTTKVEPILDVPTVSRNTYDLPDIVPDVPTKIGSGFPLPLGLPFGEIDSYQRKGKRRSRVKWVKNPIPGMKEILNIGGRA
jgi:hypothetical protein